MVSAAVRSMVSTSVSPATPAGSARRRPPASTLSENSSWEMESCSSLAILDRSWWRALASASSPPGVERRLQLPRHPVEVLLELGYLVVPGDRDAAARTRRRPPRRVSAASRCSRRVSRRVDSSPNASPTGTATASTTTPVLIRPGDTVNPPIPGAAAGTCR